MLQVVIGQLFDLCRAGWGLVVKDSISPQDFHQVKVAWGAEGCYGPTTEGHIWSVTGTSLISVLLH